MIKKYESPPLKGFNKFCMICSQEIVNKYADVGVYDVYKGALTLILM